MLKTVSLVGFLVMLAIIVFCVLLAVLVPSVRHLRRQAQETQCGHNLKQIGLALHNYHDVYKKFPWAITYAKDGTPMHSWRVRVLPYAESSAMYAAYDFDEPWNGPRMVCWVMTSLTHGWTEMGRFDGTRMARCTKQCTSHPCIAAPAHRLLRTRCAPTT